ncbi:hypothetical protein Tco_0522654 [Tanacetum coccineum]
MSDLLYRGSLFNALLPRLNEDEEAMTNPMLMRVIETLVYTILIAVLFLLEVPGRWVLSLDRVRAEVLSNPVLEGRLLRTIPLTFLLGVLAVLVVLLVLPHGSSLFNDVSWREIIGSIPRALKSIAPIDPPCTIHSDCPMTGLNEKVTGSDAAFVKAKGKSKDRKKKIKSISKTLDQFNAEAARLASDLNEFASFFQGGFQSLVRKLLASDEFSRVQGKLLSLAASAGFERCLRMDRSEEQLTGALKKISYFVLRAQGRLLEATPLVATTNCPYLNKIADPLCLPPPLYLPSLLIELEPGFVRLLSSLLRLLMFLLPLRGSRL